MNIGIEWVGEKRSLGVEPSMLTLALALALALALSSRPPWVFEHFPLWTAQSVANCCSTEENAALLCNGNRPVPPCYHQGELFPWIPFTAISHNAG